MTVDFTCRYLLPLRYRIAEAHAKIRLSNIVEDRDIQEALRLYQEAIKQSATDPRTGIVDISILTTGNILTFLCSCKSILSVTINHVSCRDVCCCARRVYEICILNVGMSATARKRIDELKTALKSVINVEKVKGSAIRCQQLLDKWRGMSDQVRDVIRFDWAST